MKETKLIYPFFRCSCLSGLLGSQLLAIPVVSDPRRRSTVATAFPGADTMYRSFPSVFVHSQGRFSLVGSLCFIPDNLSVNGAGHAVLQLQVHLGHGVVGVDGSIRDITCVARNPY